MARSRSVTSVSRSVIRWTLLSAAVPVAVIGAFGFKHVIEMDSWVYSHPFLCAFAGVYIALLLGLAMFGVQRDNPRFWGIFEIVAGCAFVWNAIATAIQQGPQVQPENVNHAAFLLSLLVGIFLIADGYK